MNRRRVLAAVGVASVPLAGCTETDPSADPTGSPTTESATAGTPTATTRKSTAQTPTDKLPADCPTTEGFDVNWPRNLDRAAVESFVEAYEAVYYREVVVEYEPNSRLDSYELAGSVGDILPQGRGWRVTYSGSGGVYRPTLWLTAEPATPPADADVVPLGSLEDDLVRALVTEAVESGSADREIAPPGPKVDRYVELFASLSADFEPLSGPGESDTLYVASDGETVEVTVQATNFHGDYWWGATYYVDSRVVWRAEGTDSDPREGTLLECRPSA